VNQQHIKRTFPVLLAPTTLLLLAPAVAAAPAVRPVRIEPTGPSTAGEEEIKHSPEARMVEFDPAVFSGDPPPGKFDPAEQEKIYGNKYPVTSQRPLLELGRELYVKGPFKPGLDWLGDKNLIWPWLQVFGDWRVAAGVSDDKNSDTARIATQLTLDVDLKLTATERLHFAIRPLENDGNFTNLELRDSAGKSDFRFDLNLDSLFFEGDLGALVTGFSGNPTSWDLPFAVGFMPLLFQNGVWVEDAFTGVAATIQAKNSRRLNISNYDVTFFAAVDQVTTAARPAGANEDDTRVVGVTTFIDANEGYWEAGYGYTGFAGGSGTNEDFNYHNLTVAFSKRYFGWLSNSIRTIFNFGQDTSTTTADGVLLLLENSLITSRPSTLVPYANLFVGINRPQSLARAAAAGGVLKNTGINYEAEAITAFPALDGTGSDAYGGAVGLQYLPGLDRQIVVELAAQDDLGRKASVKGPEAALGLRYQHPISHRFILRADAIVGLISGDDNIAGVRVEFRWKF
jgi:hypothetical protein